MHVQLELIITKLKVYASAADQTAYHAVHQLNATHAVHQLNATHAVLEQLFLKVKIFATIHVLQVSTMKFKTTMDIVENAILHVLHAQVLLHLTV